jgi:predicted neutral ceramidase superfamily lipid hydrolase
MSANLALVSGSNSLIVESFPVMLLAIALAGVGLAVWVKAYRPKVYAHLGRTSHREVE